MKRAAILCFSARGRALAERISRALEGDWTSELYAPRGGLMDAVAELFPRVQALIFVGACGIAVRAVAPLVASKKTDPAVVVVDERGNFAISLLSGHIGGANALTSRIAAAIGAQSVVTTATDVNGRFSVDTWAARKGVWIADMLAARRFSAEILERDLPIQSDFPIEGALPPGVYLGDSGACGARIACTWAEPFACTLMLAPRILHVGIGCRRGASEAEISAAVEAALDGARICREAVASASSIDVKSDEPGLSAFCASAGIALRFYSAAELNEVPGEFTASEFVKKTVGVDNVCERSALRSAGAGGRLILKKRSGGGVTVAVACEDWSVSFE